MAKILGVGIATLDIINTVQGHPKEDAEVRAISQLINRGGNTANTLVMLSQLGHQTYWHGTLADDTQAAVILNDLNTYSVNTDHAVRVKNSTSPTSYICLNQKNGSRTIVHYRDLPELDHLSFSKIDISGFDWIHFEARNIPETVKMLRSIKHNFPGITCSVECEKLRDDIHLLYKFADVLVFSKDFCKQQGFNDATHFLQNINSHKNQIIITPWADQGAFISINNVIKHITTDNVKTVVDTIGAGDAFNAGLIDGLINGHSAEEATQQGNKLAGYKITQTGFDISQYER